VGGFLKFVAALAAILLLTIDARAATVSFPTLTEKVPGAGGHAQCHRLPGRRAAAEGPLAHLDGHLPLG
jgi:hypothetical protein